MSFLSTTVFGRRFSVFRILALLRSVSTLLCLEVALRRQFGGFAAREGHLVFCRKRLRSELFSPVFCPHFMLSDMLWTVFSFKL